MKTTNYTFQHTKQDLWEIAPADGIVYISVNDKWAVMKCPCGCGDKISLSMMKGVKPCWSIDGTTLHPSVLRTTGCRSHFRITNGAVQMY